MRRAAFALAVWLLAPTARADSDPAGVQFEKGLAEMELGHYSAGCPALNESYRLDPRPGVLFTLAECNAKWGKFATALAQYDSYLEQFAKMTADQKAKQKGRERVAAAQKESLKRDVPELTIVLPGQVPKDTEVKRDGVVVPPSTLSNPIALDPGDHVVTGRTPDGRKFEERFALAKAEKRRLVIELPAPPEPPPKPSNQRTLTLVAGGVGAAGIVLGTVAGIITIVNKGTIDSDCTANVCRSTDGTNAADAAHKWGLVSTIGFGVGIAGLGAAAALYLTDKTSPPLIGRMRPGIWPAIGATPAGVGSTVGLAGAF
jgi:hypothetical protein